MQPTVHLSPIHVALHIAFVIYFVVVPLNVT